MRWLVWVGVWGVTSGCDALRDQASRGNSNRALTAEEFGDKLNDKFCDELEDCSDGDSTFECEELTGTVQVPEGCEFDADKAQDCLDDPWTCNRDYGGDFAFPQPPSACNFVIDCGSTVEVSPGSRTTGTVPP